MSNASTTTPRDRDSSTVAVLSINDAGEILTLQRAAYLTEAAAHNDFNLPPLTQTLAELTDELGDPSVTALGIREGGRLVGAVRVRRSEDAVELGRLIVAPTDRVRASAPDSCFTPRRCIQGQARCGCSPASTAQPTFASTPATVTARPAGHRRAIINSSTSLSLFRNPASAGRPYLSEP